MMIIPLPWNTIAHTVLWAQASSASAERMFSDLGRIEGDQQRSLDPGTLEMSEIIRIPVPNELSKRSSPQFGASLIHPEAQSFRGFLDHMALEVSKQIF